MIRKLTTLSWKHTSLALLLFGSATAISSSAPSAHAASEGVYISDASYFTLEQASLSSSSLQFSIGLHNRENRAIDFNEYGVRVTDTAGHSFTARLSEKKSASVLAGQDQAFRFYADIASGETPDQLQVDVFRWNSNEPDFMDHLGKLSVASVLQEGQISAPEEIINLHTLDSSLADDASVAFQLGLSVRVFEDGKWYMYTQLSAKNLGSSSIKLPADLQVRLLDAKGLKYTASVVDESDQTILPNQSDAITLKSAVSRQMPESGLTLEFYYTNQGEETSLGSMAIDTSIKTAAIGEKQDYLGQLAGEHLTVKADKATYSKQTDGTHVQTVVMLTNEGDSIAAVPSLLATYQFGTAEASVTSTDDSSRSTYLAAKETVSYYFNAVLPDGIDPNVAQLVIWEKTTGDTNSTAIASSSSSNNETAGQLPVALFLLEGASETTNGFSIAEPYQLGEKLIFHNNNVVDKNLDVSLVELHVHENDDLGYRTAIGKYKLTNKGKSPIEVPVLQNELIDSQGNSFTGTRQSSVAQQIMPGTSYVVSYSYLLPDSEEAETLALHIYDDKSVSQGNVSMGTYQVAIQDESDSNEISFYPFLLKVQDASTSWTYSGGNYTYQINLTLDLQHQDKVMIDANFSKIEFDLVDSLGRVLGTQSMSLTGANKLISGKQKITISGLKDEQISSGTFVKMYETIETPNGTAKRLVKKFQ